MPPRASHSILCPALLLGLFSCTVLCVGCHRETTAGVADRARFASASEVVSEPSDQRVAASAEPTAQHRDLSLRYRLEQWLLPAGVFLMAMVILGFLAVSALFSPPFWAWFIYLFLLPFFAWMPSMTLDPAAGWAISGLWLVAFPVLRWWMYGTPSGNRWRERQEGRIARFGAGDAGRGSWRWTGSLRSRGSARPGRSGRSSGLFGRGGRFGGGGASGRW